MPKIHDIRAKDLVTFTIKKDHVERVLDFIANIGQEDLSYHLEELILNPENTKFKVKQVLRTPKTRTEYAILIVQDGDEEGIEFPIQTRYLTLKKRAPSHRITAIFS